MSNVNWEGMHQEGNRPWDLKGVTPMLKYFFEIDEIGKKLIETGKIERILVPGCGQKNDTEYLGKLFKGAEVIGSDISPTAIETCKREVDPSIENVKFMESDFFKTELGTFDLIFDHTFFCAITPQIRNDWGKRMNQLMRENGHLLTIIYPLPLDPENVYTTKGPPFEVTFSAYESVLQGSSSFECVRKWSNNSLPMSNEKRKGREELALWLRMGQVMAMFSSFSGEKWNFDQVSAHSKKSPQDLANSREYLIDVREENEIRTSGAIPNAINIPLGSVESALKFPKIFNQFVRDSRTFPDAEADKLIFSCQSGMRAGRAAASAQALGYEKVAVYPGSFSDWSNHKK